MQDFVKRIVEEANELEERIEKLKAFMFTVDDEGGENYSDRYNSLTEFEQRALDDQLFSMRSYHEILTRRLGFYFLRDTRTANFK